MTTLDAAWTPADPTPAAASPTAAPEAATTRPTADDTTARLVAAAIEVFGEKGYDKAGVAEIARRAGLTTGAIYSRFTNKAQLLTAAITACVPGEFDQLFAEHAFAGQVVDLVRAAGTQLVDRPTSPRGSLLLEAFVAARRDPELAAALRESFGERRAKLGGLIDGAKAAGVLDADVDTYSMVHFAQAVGLGFVSYEALGVPNPDPAHWAALIAKVIGAVVTDHGAAAAPTPTEAGATDGH